MIQTRKKRLTTTLQHCNERTSISTKTDDAHKYTHTQTRKQTPENTEQIKYTHTRARTHANLNKHEAGRPKNAVMSGKL